MSHADELHTRERLLATLWGFEFAVTTRAIDHRVAEIRKVLGDLTNAGVEIDEEAINEALRNKEIEARRQIIEATNS